MAIPQEWVDKFVPERCWRNEKQPAKLVIFDCRPAFSIAWKTSSKVGFSSL